MYNKLETIKCSCGYDTGLNKNGFHKVIRDEGEKCPHCGQYIFPPKPTYPWPKPKPNKPYDGPYNPKPDIEPWKIPYPPYLVPYWLDTPKEFATVWC